MSSVHAFGAAPAARVSRSTPLPLPNAVSKEKIASIAFVPARVTSRGAARSGSMAKPDGAASAACDFNAAKMASRPLTVCSVQLMASTSRQ